MEKWKRLCYKRESVRAAKIKNFFWALNFQVEYACILYFLKCTNKSRIPQSQITPYRGLDIGARVAQKTRHKAKMQPHTILVSWEQVRTHAGSGGQETDIQHAEFTSEEEKWSVC